eukprot:1905956-Rhodomonas_salina.1
MLARAREDREKTDKRVTREQKADEAKQWLKRIMKDFPGAGTFSAVRTAGENLSPVLWALNAYHHNKLT